jgi:hypothetical protein
MPRDRMFRVLVLGGIAFVEGSACGGSADVWPNSGAEDGSVPRVRAQPQVSSPADTDVDTGFPSETNGSTTGAASQGALDAGEVNDAAAGAGRDAADSAACPPGEVKSGTGCFPIEGPQ